jgi:hypothetical protein
VLAMNESNGLRDLGIANRAVEELFVAGDLA